MTLSARLVRLALAGPLALACGVGTAPRVDPPAPRAPERPAEPSPDAGPAAPSPELDAGPLPSDGAPVTPDASDGCRPLEMVVEARWPFEGVEIDWPSHRHVTSTPLVLPPARPGGAPRLAFVSHAPLVDYAAMPVPSPIPDGPIAGGRMRVERGGVLRVVDLDTGRTVSWGDPPHFQALAPTSTLAAADLDGDGALELIAVGAAAGLHAFELDGTRLWSATAPPYAPIVPPRPIRTLLSVSGAPTVADLEGDGTVEVVFGPCVVEGATGATRFCLEDEMLSASQAYWGPLVSLADLDGDGALDVLAGRVAYAADGRVLWRLDTPWIGFPVLGELLPDRPGLEVAVIHQSHVFMVEARTGRYLHYFRAPGAPFREIYYAGGPPLALDFDGDGADELVLANFGLLLRLDPACDGCEVVWSTPILDSSGVTGVSAVDLDGDGRPELLHGDEGHLRVVDSRSGEVLYTARNNQRARTEYPVAADVDGDGSVEILAASSSDYDEFPEERPTPSGVTVFGERFGRWSRVGASHLQHGGTLEHGRRWPRLGPGAPFEAGCE